MPIEVRSKGATFLAEGVPSSTLSILQRMELQMKMNLPLVFAGITTDQFAQLAAKARANGIDINGNTGYASQFGVEVSWDYVPLTC
jgi:hypothetical protein